MLSGTISDVSGEPLVGASIVEKGTTNGTLTNINGMFSLPGGRKCNYSGFLYRYLTQR